MTIRITLVEIAAAIVVAAGSANAAGEEPLPGTRTVTIVPGARYQSGWFRRIFLGGHWRDAWNTPIEVPVLDFVTFDGGLTPERQGGGNETLVLHFKSAQGRTWVFRSVDKDPRRKLDPETAEGWIGDLTQDMISGAHPAASLVVAPLLEAAGVLHATPQLTVLPDDPRLGAFRREFAGVLGTIEERIEHRIPGGDKVEETLPLFERLEQRSDEHVDARDYLRCRLMDVLVGDWDRHTDQYRWVRFDEGSGHVWRVVPRDRDEAFSRFDGALPSMAEYYGKPLAGWGDSFPPIDKVTFAGRYSDRRFLTSLERDEWDAVTADVVAKVTDAVIADAVRRLPAPMYAQAGERLEHDLRARRDLLAQASKEYYRLLAQEADVRGTTRDEDFQLERHPDGSLSVAVYARGEKNGSRAADPYFRRTFRPDETSEVRLYTMGGRDRVVEEGNGTNAILLRVVSPPGTSEIAGSSPQRSATRIYASAEVPPPPVKVDGEKLTNDDLRSRYEVFRDWGRDYLVFPQFSYDGTRGLFFGASLQRTAYQFGLDPYASQMRFAAAWSTKLSRPRIEYAADFHTRTRFSGLLYLAYSGVEQAKFFGFGNETPRVTQLDTDGFYDADQNQFVAKPMIEIALAGPLRARVGAEFKHVSSAYEPGTLIAQVRPSGAGGMSVGSAEAGFVIGETSGTYPSQRSIQADVAARVSPSIFSNPATFGKVRGSVAAHYGTHLLTNVQLSARVQGERNFGTYPFFESAFLGGTPAASTLDAGAFGGNLLRGYDLNRFAGDAAVAANTEIDVELGKWSAFLPWRYGVFGLYDAGRVFLDGESSSKWHTAWGGGVWLGLFASSPYFQLTGSLRAAMVSSDQGSGFYIASGFGL